jgi:hypothetical protein
MLVGSKGPAVSINQIVEEENDNRSYVDYQLTSNSRNDEDEEMNGAKKK